MTGLKRAALNRLNRVRTGVDGETVGDSGFALLFVLLVTMLVTLGTASMLAVVANNIGPARQSQNSEAALAAAQAGIQNYIATLNQQCISYSVQGCPWLLQTQQGSPLTGTIGTETYSTKAENSSSYLSANNGDLRLMSTGTSNGITQTLVADVSGNPSPLRYAYFSDYETVSSDFVAHYAPSGSNQIVISSDDANKALGLSSGTTTKVSWAGLTDATTSICDEHYYNDPVTGAAGRQQSSAGADDSANPSLITQTGSNTGTNLSPSIPSNCEVNFSDGMSFNGPVYSQDALLLSNGTAANSGVGGPTFNVPSCTTGQTPGTATPCETIFPATTGWSTTNVPANSTTTPYRSTALPVGGTPSPAGSVHISPTDLSLPNSDQNAVNSATIICTGPANITLAGSVVTLPSNCSTTSVDLSKVAATTVYVKASGSPGPTASTPCGSSSYAADITAYSTTAGDACISGSLGSSATGKLSIVAAHDVIVTGNLTTTNGTTTNAFGERSISSGSALDLVANNDVLLYNPVRCNSGTAVANAAVVDAKDLYSPTYAYCPNDITGLYNANGNNGQPGATAVVSISGGQESLRTSHPARQYCDKSGNSYPCSGTNSASCDYLASSAIGATNAPLTIDAAVFALNGSLTTDNYNRGCALGTAQVNGGVYENHRGAVGEEWEIPNSTTVTQRAYSGYKLQINYVSYQDAQVPYVPSLQAGAPNSPWIVLALSTGSGS